MKQLRGTKWKYWQSSCMKKVRDLVEFDGPLLTHYEHTNGDDYLFHWVDCDESHHRWMILRVDEASILRLVNRVVPLDFVVPSLCRDPFVLFADIDDGALPTSTTLVDVNDIPSDYLPQKGAWLPVGASLASDTEYTVLVEGGWSVSQLGEFPSMFSKAYSLLYGMNVLALKEFSNFPWRGGFSSYHFFNWIAKAIPSEHQPGVDAIQYASPGFMRFNLHGATALQVAQCISNYKYRNAQIVEAYSRLYKLIRDNKLNDEEQADSAKLATCSKELSEGARDLIVGFELIDVKEFMMAASRPFEAAKIAMAFYRYIKQLVEFEKEGRVRYANTKPMPPSPVA